jgi:thiol-disulfide isomerase/thioredoxin
MARTPDAHASEDGPTPEGDPRPGPLRTAFTWLERALFLGLLLFALHRLGPQLSAWTGIGPIEGSTPEYAVTLFDGSRLTSEELRGKVVVLNVWATWCPPCRVEIPALQALHEDTRAEGDVVVLGLATDVQGAGIVSPFLEERGVSYANGMLDRETRRALGGISHTPTTFVIGPDGVVRHKVLGFFAPPAMRAAVRRLQPESDP